MTRRRVFARNGLLYCAQLIVITAILSGSDCNTKGCPRGFGVAKPCEGHSDRICIQCVRNRTFSAHWGLESCRPCATCEKDEEVWFPCTRRRNTVCHCKEGFGRDGETGTCRRQVVNRFQRSKVKLNLTNSMKSDVEVVVSSSKSFVVGFGAMFATASSGGDLNYFANLPHAGGGGGGGSTFGKDDVASSTAITTWQIILIVLIPVLSGLVIFKVWQISRKNGRTREMKRIREQESPLLEEGVEEEEEANGREVFEMPIRKGETGPPRFVEPLKSLYCHEGTETELICFVSASPEPDVWWEFNGNKIDENDEEFSIVNPTETTIEAILIIKHPRPRLAGRYSCTARNDHGQAITQASLAIIGEFDQEVEPPRSDCLINNTELPVTTPDTAEASDAASSAGTLYNADLGETLRTRFPGTCIRIGPCALRDDDESVSEEDTLYAQRMAYHVGFYKGSYLEEMQERRREDVSLRAQEMGFTRGNIRFLAGAKLSSDDDDEESHK